MGRESKLMKNTMIIGIGMMCTKGVSFLLLPLYTSLLTTEQYGMVDVVNTLVTLVTYALTMQFEQGIFRYLVDCRHNRKQQEEYISTTVVTLTGTLVAGLIISGIICKIVNFPYVFYLLANIAISLYVAIFNQIARGLGRVMAYTISSFLSAAGQIVFNVFFIAGLRWNVEGMLLATIIGQVISCIFIFFSCNISAYIRINSFAYESFRRLLKYSLPLVPNTICWWLVNFSDRLIIKWALGTSYNGIYAVANKFPALFMTMTNVFQLSWTENASEYSGEDDRDQYYSKIMNQSVIFMISFCSMVLAILPLLFTFLVDKKYDEAYYHILILVIAGLFHAWANLYGSLFGALKYTKYIAKTTIYSAFINIVINFCCINFIGLFAASISTLVAYAIVAFMRHVHLKKRVTIVYCVKDLLIVFSVLALTSISYFWDNFIISIIASLVSIMVFIILNKRYISILLNKFRTKKGSIK